MINAALLEALRELPRQEKLRVIEFLATDLAKTESEVQSYPVLTPFGSAAGAAILQRFLRDDSSADS